MIISIIVPAYRAEPTLEKCLQAIRQSIHKDYELIVVDDGSSLSLENAVSYVRREKMTVTFIQQPNAGPASARNQGAAQAKGDYLAFVDDDCRVSKDWLQKLAAYLNQSPDSAVTGGVLNALPGNLYSRATQYLNDYFYHYFNSDHSDAKFMTSMNFVVPAKQFRAIGGFEGKIPFVGSDDRIFCDRLIKQGYSITYNPDILVFHYHDLTFRKFWKQHFNYGRGAFHYRRLQAGLSPKKLETPSFYFNLILFPFFQKKNPPAALIAALLIVSQTATAAGFFWEWILTQFLNQRRRYHA